MTWSLYTKMLSAWKQTDRLLHCWSKKGLVIWVSGLCPTITFCLLLILLQQLYSWSHHQWESYFIDSTKHSVRMMQIYVNVPKSLFTGCKSSVHLNLFLLNLSVQLIIVPSLIWQQSCDQEMTLSPWVEMIISQSSPTWLMTEITQEKRLAVTIL